MQNLINFEIGPEILRKLGMKFVRKQTSIFVSHLKKSVTKWTGGDEKMGKQAGEERKGMETKFTRMFQLWP